MDNIAEKDIVFELLKHGITYRKIADSLHVHTTRITCLKKELIASGWNPKDIVPYENEEAERNRLAEIENVVLKEIGEKYTPRGKSRKEYNEILEQRKEQAKSLQQSGMTIKQIAREMETSETTVKKWFQCMGVRYASETKKRTALPPEVEADFKAEWTRAVNRIRRYFGKEEFKEEP